MKQFFQNHVMVLEADIRFLHDLGALGGRSCEIHLKLRDRNIFKVHKGETFGASVRKAIEQLGYQIKNK